MSGMCWVEIAPCGCISAAINATRWPDKADAVEEFRLLADGTVRGWPIELTTYEDARARFGCAHAPKWRAVGQEALL